MVRTTLLAPFLLLACTTAATEDDGGAARVPEAPMPDAPNAPAATELQYTADLRVMESFPVQLDARMTVHNPSGQTAPLEVPGGCPLHLLAYRDSARTEVAWDQGQAIVCTLQLEVIQLAPGAQREFTTRTDARSILGDSLPDGVYYMRVRLTINDTVIAREAGSVQLAVPR